MASLSELVAAADYQQRGKEAADPLYSGVQAFAGGLTKGADQNTGDKSLKRLAVYGKLLEVKQKIDAAKQQTQQQAAAKKALQAAGVLPLDAEDEAVARQVANSKIGTEGLDPNLGTKTNAGKLAVLVNKAQMQSGIEFDPAGTMNSYTSGKGGIKFKNKKSLTATDEKPADRMRVRGLAADMAKQAYAAKVQRDGTGDPYGMNDPADMVKAYVPTPEDISAFEPRAHEYLYGKKPDAPAPQTPAAKKDPLDKVGDLGDVSSLWDLLK